MEVFGASSSLPPLVDRGVRLVLAADEKVSLCSAHFAAKQCRDSLQQPHSCGLSLVLCSVAFRFSFVSSLCYYFFNVGTFNVETAGGSRADI